jgi:hypothetical protein
MIAEIVISEIKESEIGGYFFENDFSDRKTDRRFIVISIKEKNYLIGWQSDLIEPKIQKIELFSLISIGIDLKLIIIDYKNNKVLINQPLNYFFLSFFLHNTKLIVATELEILLIDLRSMEIRSEGLPDNFDSLTFEKEKILITCVDESKVYIQD